jgi:co-chaperonin GroES (HSP10)
MKLIGRNLLITEVKEEIKTSSGLLLSSEDVSKFRYSKGVVENVGSEVSCINVGDEIYYDKGNGYKMIIHDENYTLIQESAVVVVL